MDLWNKITGTVRMEITCADPERLLNRLIADNIELWNVDRISPILLELRIKRKDLRSIMKIAEKYGASVQLIGLHGLLFQIKTWTKRPLLLGCLLFLGILTMLLPERILFVDVAGNEQVPTGLILEEAAKQGLHFWTDRRALRSEKIKNELLGTIEGLQWVGVNTKGSRAVIHVRERDLQNKEEAETYTSLIACTDGIIQDIVMNRGTLLCKSGQAVRQGDILVSGYTDVGICTRITDVNGEIYALTNRKFSAAIPNAVQIRSVQRRKEVRLSLIFGKKRINLYSDSGILPSGCGKMTYTYPLKLPGGDILPVMLVIQRIVWYDISNILRTQSETEEILLQAALRNLMEQTIACQILDQQVQLDLSTDPAVLQGIFQCREMIARGKTGVFLEGDTQDDSQNSQRGAG